MKSVSLKASGCWALLKWLRKKKMKYCCYYIIPSLSAGWIKKRNQLHMAPPRHYAPPPFLTFMRNGCFAFLQSDSCRLVDTPPSYSVSAFSTFAEHFEIQRVETWNLFELGNRRAQTSCLGLLLSKLWVCYCCEVSPFKVQMEKVKKRQEKEKLKPIQDEYRDQTHTMLLLGNTFVFLTLLLCLIFKVKKKLIYKWLLSMYLVKLTQLSWGSCDLVTYAAA